MMKITAKAIDVNNIFVDVSAIAAVIISPLAILFSARTFHVLKMFKH